MDSFVIGNPSLGEIKSHSLNKNNCRNENFRYVSRFKNISVFEMIQCIKLYQCECFFFYAAKYSDFLFSLMPVLERWQVTFWKQQRFLKVFYHEIAR